MKCFLFYQSLLKFIRRAFSVFLSNLTIITFSNFVSLKKNLQVKKIICWSARNALLILYWPKVKWGEVLHPDSKPVTRNHWLCLMAWLLQLSSNQEPPPRHRGDQTVHMKIKKCAEWSSHDLLLLLSHITGRQRTFN